MTSENGGVEGIKVQPGPVRAPLYQNSHRDILDGDYYASDDGAWSGPDPDAGLGSGYERAGLI